MMMSRAVSVLLLVVVVCFCAVTAEKGSSGSQGQLGPADSKLTRPLILELPKGQATGRTSFTRLASLLKNEPEVAREVQEPVGDDTDSIDDVKLLGPVDCTGDCPKAEKSINQAIELALDPDAQAARKKVHEEILNKEQKIVNAEKQLADNAASNKTVKGSELDSIQGEITSLEGLIKHAMVISRQIPDKVRQLEDLKKKQQEITETKAREEAAKTLKKHEKLIAEIDAEMAKHKDKLKELQTRKNLLTASNSRLQQGLTGGGSKVLTSLSDAPKQTPSPAAGGNSTSSGGPLSKQLELLASQNPL